MPDLTRPGHLVVTMRPGEAPPGVPCHLDHVLVSCRPSTRFDRGPVQRALNRLGGASQCVRVYHARRSLGHVGEQHVGFDDVEEALGLSRTFRFHIADPERTANVIQALRELRQVESAAVQRLASAPFSAEPLGARAARHGENGRGRVDGRSSGPDAWAPHRRVGAPEALRIEPGDQGVTVAIIDSGVALGHPELQRRCLSGYDIVEFGMGRLNGDVILLEHSSGHDFNPLDRVGHGSHVAGVVGAHGWQIPPGLAGRCLLLPIRVLAAARMPGKPDRVGVGSLADIDGGIKVAVDLGADVLQMSFGTSEAGLQPDDPRPHERSVAYAAHYGCTLVAAAGNDGDDRKFYPAAHRGVIAVASVDAQGRRSVFSSYGGHIAVSAPGEQVVSLGRRGYMVSTGTSPAAPFVSGAAALLLARARRAGRRLDGQDVCRILTESARPLGGGGFSRETGHGLLDAAAALRLLERSLAAAGPPARPAGALEHDGAGDRGREA
jgi:subtilisin family serine protease